MDDDDIAFMRSLADTLDRMETPNRYGVRAQDGRRLREIADALADAALEAREEYPED